jgi:hypothetical protein
VDSTVSIIQHELLKENPVLRTVITSVLEAYGHFGETHMRTAVW